MKLSIALAALLALGAPASATPEPYDTARNELLGSLCEEGLSTACRTLVQETNGECAGPVGSGCRYSSVNFQVIDPEEPMVLVPGLQHLGWSRISTVQHCAYLTEVEDWAELTTDSELEGMESCLVEHT
jgi:hypothetical protein